MKLALRRHGICRRLKLTDILCDWESATRPVARDDILTGRFFVDLRDESLWDCYLRHYKRKIQAIIEDAEAICRREFNILDSGILHLDDSIDWHIDPLSAYRWPNVLYTELKRGPNAPRQGTDIKIPWELSRMQHLPTLGKAFQITKEERYAEEIIHQIDDWLENNPCPFGVNWVCPMDIAIRIMNIIWGYQFIHATTLVTNEFRSRLAIAIFQHAQCIFFNLEYGIQHNGLITNNNHYLTNIVGLLHIGVLCPEFSM
jgi:hypothetical protein